MVLEALTLEIRDPEAENSHISLTSTLSNMTASAVCLHSALEVLDSLTAVALATETETASETVERLLESIALA